AGRFDGARVEIGAVDWETLERATLYNGAIGRVSHEEGRFAAALRSAKTMLEEDFVPRTSPTCRAAFCGPGCTLAAVRFTHEALVEAIDFEAGTVRFSAPAWNLMAGGRVR